MRKDKNKVLRRSVSLRPRRRVTQDTEAYNMEQENKCRVSSRKVIAKRAGMNGNKIGFRNKRHISRLESMKNIFGGLNLTDDSQSVCLDNAENTVSRSIRLTDYTEGEDCFTRRRITRRHSMATESIIRPYYAKEEEFSTWTSERNCILECSRTTQQLRPSGSSVVYLGLTVGSGLYYWTGTATNNLGSNAFIFGHKSNGEWRYLTNVDGLLRYRENVIDPKLVDLENISDSRVFFLEDSRLVSATETNLWIGIRNRGRTDCLNLVSINYSEKWKLHDS